MRYDLMPDPPPTSVAAVHERVAEVRVTLETVSPAGSFGAVLSAHVAVPLPEYPPAQVPHVWLLEVVQVSPEEQFVMDA